jgi:filamentous hemagglutinin family protein
MSTTSAGTLRKSLAASAAMLVLAAAGAAHALPTFGSAQVTPGDSQPVIATPSPTLMTIDVNAARTIIDWTSFNLAPGETVSYAFQFNRTIVLNRVNSGPINIDGQILSSQSVGFPLDQPRRAGGNVWFYSPQGVIFGPNARFDGGALLATSAAVNASQFLNQSFSLDFTGSGSGGPVTVAAGATFVARGHLAFIAPVVTTAAGSTINAGDYGTVAYGGVDSYRINFVTIANDDLSFFDFIVPSAAAGSAAATPLRIAGTTTGANVYLSAISRSQLNSLLIDAPGLLVGQSSFNNYGQVTITTGRNITSGQVNELSSPVVGALTGDARVGVIDATGNVNVVLSGAQGAGNLTADRIRAGQAGLIVANNVTVGPQGITAGDTGVNLGGLNLDVSGTIDAPRIQTRTNFNVFSNRLQFNGSINDPSDLPTLRLGTVTSGNIISISADTLNATSMTAASVRASTAGALTVGSATGSTEVLMASSTNMTLGSVSTPGLTRLTFEDLTLTGSVTAGSATLRILTPGQATVGGSGQARGVSNAELQRFRVNTSMSIFGGIDGAFPVTNNLVVEDLDIDPSRIPDLRLFAKTTQDILIRGVLRPTTSGGLLTIGDGAADSIWLPRRILVTGALGSASGDALAGFTDVRAFNGVEMRAGADILFGSQRFLDLIGDLPAAQIDIGRGLPLGVAAQGDEIGKLFLVAGNLTLAADNRILQQNTGRLGLEGGLYLTGAGIGANEPILTIGRAQIADLFGAFQSGDGVLAIGAAGAFSSRIARLEGDTSQGQIRINGCLLGIGCALSTPASQFRIQQFRPAAAQGAVDPPVLTPPPPLDDDEREAEAVTTGAGNEEIWRREPQ